MLRWVRRRLGLSDPRLLFSYSDGRRDRWADPIATAAAIEEAYPEWGEAFDLLRDDPNTVPAGAVRDDFQKQQKDARVKLLAAVRAAFGVEAFGDKDGKPAGLTEAETVALFHRFLLFFFAASDSARPTETWPPPGAGCQVASPTAPSAASGSTEG